MCYVHATPWVNSHLQDIKDKQISEFRGIKKKIYKQIDVFKKRRFLFPSIFENKKDLKNYKKKSLKNKNTEETLVKSVSFVFLCYMGLRHNTTMFRAPLKRELLLMKKKKKTKKRTFRRWCILPSSFSGVQRVQEPAKSDGVLITAGCGTF